MLLLLGIVFSDNENDKAISSDTRDALVNCKGTPNAVPPEPLLQFEKKIGITSHTLVVWQL